MSSRLDISLPESWYWSPLKHMTTFLNRGTAPDYVDDGPVRVIGQAANQAGGLDWGRTRFHAHSGDTRTLKGHLHPHDVLINSTGTGTLGRVGYFEAGPDDRPSMVDAHITIARADPESVEPRFMYYWLNSTPFQDYLYAALVVGATNQIELNRDRFAGAPIAVPPIDEQRRIGEFLDAETARTDHLASESTRQKKLIEARLLESMRVATTGESDDVISTSIPWMPLMSRRWKLSKVSRVFLTSSGTTPRADDNRYFDGPIPWVNSSDLTDGAISGISRSVTLQALADYSALKIQPAGALIVAMYGQGDTKGRVGILRSPACLNQACCALISTGQVLPDYAAYWFRAHKYGIVSLAAGAGQPNLSQELIRQLKIPTPKVEEQKCIIELIKEEETDCGQQQSLLDLRSRLLGERRQALITAAVTGQFDVTTARTISTSEAVPA
ncbi:restriction endonuclease subunit S [Mycobacterium sp. pUA109]|uniref:restriction endonuclease subunit S n=1 Tax=Mycobacterium sp. pUA109 TaxID=3238982 RepID=UPI00351B2C0D